MVRAIGVTRLKRLTASFQGLAGELGRMLNIRETAQGSVEVVLEKGTINIPRREIMNLTLKWQFDDIALHYMNSADYVHTDIPENGAPSDIQIPLIGSAVDVELALQTAYAQGARAVEVVWPGDEHRQYPEAYQAVVDKLVEFAKLYKFRAAYMEQGRLVLFNDLHSANDLYQNDR